MSIEAVAAQAGVAKTTIYRRFSDKVDLVSAARAGLDADAATQLLVGAFFAHYLHRGRPDEDWPERVVDAIWPALVTPPG